MKNLKGACLFGQSGGPTSVINASAAGVFIEALEQDLITDILGAEHGIKGILDEKLFDIRQEDLKELYLSHIEKAVLMMGVDHVGISSDDMTFSIALFGEDYGNMVFDYSNIQKELKNLFFLSYK